MLSEVEIIEEDNQSIDTKIKNKSPERLLHYPGSETVYDKEIDIQDYKYMRRAKRKNLKSATARSLYDNVIAKHNH